MCQNHWYTFQYHVKYIHNSIVKPFSIFILQYYKRICEMHYLNKYLYLPSKKGDMYNQYNWRVQNSYFTEYGIGFTTKYGLPTSMQGKIRGKDVVYCSLNH